MPKLSDLKKGEKGKIVDVSSQKIPMKLLEMGCLPCLLYTSDAADD